MHKIYSELRNIKSFYFIGMFDRRFKEEYYYLSESCGDGIGKGEEFYSNNIQDFKFHSLERELFLTSAR